ncbi:MAG TPA: glycoside hydrolase family 9 protein [Dysgonamonadaceae bacterium]|nr:glycoside hydrolase family 9 protein [Dysgonamonadaceae bacterium]
MRNSFVLFLLLILICFSNVQAQGFTLNPKGYFCNEGVNVMVFNDIYPEGHQGGITIVMNSDRMATNGDIRFEATPGQWQPLPILRHKKVDEKNNSITVTLSYPDSSRHMSGFNPMLYYDYVFQYTIHVKGEEDHIKVTVDLDKPIPKKYQGKIGFNLELYPGALIGKPWIIDEKSDIFPPQPNGPVLVQKSNINYIGNFNPKGKANVRYLLGNKDVYNPMIADNMIAEPYAKGKKLTLCPDDPYHKLTIESRQGDLALYDGRMNHNNGWFVVRTEIPKEVSKNAIEWIISPNIVKGWQYTPVVQVSQIGYHPNQPKVAVIELDKRDKNIKTPVLYQITDKDEKVVKSHSAKEWGEFFRYNYLQFDFSEVKEEGLYQVRYGNSASAIFRIASDIYERGVWQPELEYFLPVQMCHMRVNEKYRVWHDLCHMDDAQMAPVNLNHIDGYFQGSSTLTKYQSGDLVHGLNIGGWHDAGDYDLRIESQAGEAYILALAYETFGIDYDATTIDQVHRITEIHQPDGKPDILQQVENGALNIIAGYRALGRLYRGIICNSVRQYVLLGDGSADTDNQSGNSDDRWVFTEDNPVRELTTAAQLAAISRSLKNFNDTLSTECLEIAEDIYNITKVNDYSESSKIHAAIELYLTTGKKAYSDYVISKQEYIVQNINSIGWFIGRYAQHIDNQNFSKAVFQAMYHLQDSYEKLSKKSPYGVPYDKGNRTSGSWDVQTLGFYYCFLHDAYPDIFSPNYIFNSINFILGCHPGSNTTSFVSGVGAKSATVAYGVNRADWSYIPGGVTPGTILIRPDLPELLDYPFLWQEGEYCMGGEASYFMYMVLAAQKILNKK